MEPASTLALARMAEVRGDATVVSKAAGFPSVQSITRTFAG